jgi:hypothetical protein
LAPHFSDRLIEGETLEAFFSPPRPRLPDVVSLEAIFPFE